MTLAAALLAVACAGGSSTGRTPTPAAAVTGAASIPSAVTAVPTTPAATPIPTTTEDAVLEQDVRACMTALPDDTAGAGSRLDECLNRGEAGFHVVGVTGDVPIVLIERAGEPGMCRAHAFIVWFKDGWHVQNATVLLPDPVDERLLGEDVLPPQTGPTQASSLARQQANGEITLLGGLAGEGCNPSPGTVPMLFALEGDTWRLAWSPLSTSLRSLFGPYSEFAEPAGIDRVRVRGFLWELSLNAMFHESRPGPHRYVDETWVRDGEGYALSDHQVEPSAYATLYDFVYRLSTGDDAGAAALLVDPSLLDTAKRLGMIQQPLGQRWMTNLDADTQCCGPIHILSGPEWQPGPPQPIVVTFEQRGGDWLISGIAAE